MIFYFTGTGNSGYIASELAKGTDDRIISISQLINNKETLNFTLNNNEAVGFVFPIYAWAPPKMVMDFIKKVKFSNFNSNYIYAVATCGADIGNTMTLIKKTLNSKNLDLNSGFSLSMPNNYIIMGNVESKDIQENKLKLAKEKIFEINNIIKKREKNVFEVNKGPVPLLLTNIINPMFTKHATDPSKFYATDKCVGCGICTKVCNCNTITLVDKKPVWNKDCCMCLACIHSCPKEAIQYGKRTINKGRYVNPYFNNIMD